jgi:hypothetical protein
MVNYGFVQTTEFTPAPTVGSNPWRPIGSMPERIDSYPANRNRFNAARCSQAAHHACAISLVAMGILMQLDVADPVPTLKAPAVSHQAQQCFWGCAEADQRSHPRRCRLPLMISNAGRWEWHLEWSLSEM